MSVSQSRVIAVPGGLGQFGAHIVKELVSRKNFDVTVFVRPGSLADGKKAATADTLRAAGAKVVEADTSSPETFAGFDTVICSVSGGGIPGQISILNAAKQAGVKKFWPSEYSTFDFANEWNEPVFASKLKVREAIKESGLDYAFVENGLFMDFLFQPFMGFNFDKADAPVYGSPNNQIKTTKMADSAHFIVDAVNNPAANKRTLLFAGDSITWGQIVDLLEHATGKKWSTTVHSVEAVETLHRGFAGNPGASLIARLKLAFAKDEVRGPNNNVEISPDFRPQTVAEYVRLTFAKA